MNLIRMLFRSRRKYLFLILSAFLIIYSIASLSNADVKIDFSHLKTNFQNILTNDLLPIETLVIDSESPQSLLQQLSNSLYEKLSNPNIRNSHWKLSDKFINNKIDTDVATVYIATRKTKHLYDPRITMSVYLNHLKNEYLENSQTIPFSWEDWVDLSYLNQYLGDSRLNCVEFYNSYHIPPTISLFSELSAEEAISPFCIDDQTYLKTEAGQLKNPNLLTGFNFKDRIDQKSTFLSKTFNAKSYILSHAKPPQFIYFLNENGTYFKAETELSSSMMQNHMFDNYIENNDNNQFDPFLNLQNIDSMYLTHNENDFNDQLLKKSDFKLDIPSEKFEFDPDVKYKELFSKKQDELEDFEKLFLDSLVYSKNIQPKSIKKYFKEVNLRWPANYNGHKLTENGGHYDARFFSGLVTEMPESELSSHSPWFDGRNITDSVDNPINRRNSILSHMLHTLLSVTFHNGLYMFPAHGSLLGWYFTGTTFPWDSDGDVQMPIADLAEFCLHFNNSMIVQNPKYGMSKYYVDCTSTLTHRIKGNGNNNIDARVIDIDSGLFIDVTGLSVSGDPLSIQNMNELNGWVPREFKSKYPALRPAKSKVKPGFRINNDKEVNGVPVNLAVKDAELEAKVYKLHKDNKIYNCRNHHYYTHEMISPVRLTMFEGAPTFVVADIKSLRKQLETEYKLVSLSNPSWDQWVFSKSLGLWVHADDIYHILLQNKIEVNRKLSKKNKRPTIKKNIKGQEVLRAFLQNEPFVTSELIKKSVQDITNEPGLSSSRKMRYNLIEGIYRDMMYTGVHAKEMKLSNTRWEWKSSTYDTIPDLPNKLNDIGTWMLMDHSPVKMPLLDFLISAETDSE